MKVTQVFGRTLRDDQREADVVSHNLLLRAGYIRQLASGIFSYMHYGLKSLKKIEQIIREEMDAIGGDEICMPIVHPADIWQKTGRWEDIDDSMVRFTDRNERNMVLAMTHEEVVANLASKEIDTYKQLPKLPYQIYTKFRDELRSRGGLIRVREFTMKDSYSLDKDITGLEKQYQAHYKAYFRIFDRAGLPSVAILSDTGMMGGRIAHEYMYITPIGEDTIFLSEDSGYKANKEVARFRKIHKAEDPKELEKVFTPEKSNIAELAEFLNVADSNTAKIVFFHGNIADEDKVIVAVIRGDWEANPNKIQKLLGAKNLRTATADEILAIGAVPGYASPIGLIREKCIVIVDDWVANSNNLVAGANETNFHFLNTCYGRDYTADMIADIASAFEGALCPESTENGKLRVTRGIEIGNIFQLGTKYTDALGAFFTDIDGKSKPIMMGSYGIGVGRMLACLGEEYHDELGLCLPISIAPYQVVIVALLDNDEVREFAGDLYQELKGERIEVLYDDRNSKTTSAGVKFKDAELIGIPIRITVSKRGMKEGAVEIKMRKGEGKGELIKRELIVGEIHTRIKALFSELSEKIRS